MPPEHWENYVFNLTDLQPANARKRFRAAIKSEWGCCAYCGRETDDNGFPIHLTIDHVRPRSHGGSTLRSNLVPACVSCNHAKGSERDWKTWFRTQHFFCAERAARIALWIQPLPTQEAGYWRVLGGAYRGPELNSRTVLSAQADSNRSARSISRRTNQRSPRLLGGAISAKADVYGEQSISWLCLQNERRGHGLTA